MNKAVKLGMIGAGILVAVVVVAVIAFVATFDVNDYKGTIARLVTQKTGRELTFGGDISLTFFPQLGVRMNGVSLSNAPGFDDMPMLEAGQARLEVRFVPLLRGHIRFGELSMEGVTLRLLRDGQGRTNWDDLTHRDATSSEVFASPGRGAGDAPFVLEVDGVSVVDSTLIWDDRQDAIGLTLHDVSLTTGAIDGALPFSLTARCAFESASPAAQGRIDLSARTTLALDTRRVSLADVALTFTAEGKDVPGGTGAITASATGVNLDLRKELVGVTGLTAAGYGATVHLDGSLVGFGARCQAEASVKVDSFDARSSLALLAHPLSLKDAKALTQVGGSCRVVIDGGGWEVNQLQATVDETHISGSLGHRASEDRPADTLRLQVDTLDVDRYLPSGGGSTSTDAGGDGADTSAGAKVAVSRDTSPHILDAAFLRALSLDAEVSASMLRVAGIRIDDAAATVKARHGLVRISPVKAGLYGGTLSAAATINAVTDRPRIDLLVGLDRVDVAGISRDALGSDEYQGRLTFNGAVSCDGERLISMLASMNGKTSTHLADGVFPGVDLMGMARTTHARRDSTNATVEAAKSDKTSFGSISSSSVIQNGVARSRDLEVKAPGLRADGQGAVALPTGAIDYLIKVKLVATSEGQGGKASGDLYGVLVPIRVTGTLEDPHYRVSIAEYLKALGGVVLDTAGSVIGGVTGVIKGVGQAITGGNSTNDSGEKKRGFLGLF
jgi:AsmA protein